MPAGWVRGAGVVKEGTEVSPKVLRSQRGDEVGQEHAGRGGELGPRRSGPRRARW